MNNNAKEFGDGIRKAKLSVRIFTMGIVFYLPLLLLWTIAVSTNEWNPFQGIFIHESFFHIFSSSVIYLLPPTNPNNPLRIKNKSK